MRAQTTTTERTPLLYRGGGGGGGGGGTTTTSTSTANKNNTTAPAASSSAFYSTATATTNNAASSYYYAGGDAAAAVTTADDDCKRDRRGFFGRSVSMFQRMFRSSPSSRQWSLWSSSSSSYSAPPSSSSCPTSGSGTIFAFARKQQNASSSSVGGLLNDKYMYEDPYNDESFACSCGTNETNGIWMNLNDQVGTLMSSLVWILFLYSAVTVILLSENNHNNNNNSDSGNKNHKFVFAALYCTICAMALASHAKTCLTDPGTVPTSALPPLANTSTPANGEHTMCSICQTYKPPKAHHCRICDRCVSQMDHHCPWMNNCIGAANLKHFILFLAYTWIACVTALLLFGVNYFFCNHSECEFDPVQIQLVRVMTWLCIGALVFTSSMIVSVLYGIMTGIGTIDRLKRKSNNTWHLSIDEPTSLQDIFGIGPYWTWLVPTDPIFDDYDRIMGYATLQRLLRKEHILQRLNNNNGNNNNNIDTSNNNATATAIANIDNNVNVNVQTSSWEERQRRQQQQQRSSLGGTSSSLEGLPPPYEPVDV